MFKNFLSISIITLAMSSACFSQSTYTEDVINTRLNHGKVLSLNLGWNSLAGLGPVYTINKGSYSIDSGLGLGGSGVKLGARARYIFSPTKKTSPFAGIGLMYITPSREASISDTSNTLNNITYKVDGSPFLQLTTGIDHYANNGFYMQFSLGYSLLLGDDNIKIKSSTSSVSQKQKDVFKAAFGSNFTAGLSFGLSF